MKLVIGFALLAVAFAQDCCPHNPDRCQGSQAANMRGLSMPPGFCLNEFATLAGPRSLDIHEFPDLGTVVFTGSRGNSGSTMNVFIDANGDGTSDRQFTFPTGMNRAHVASMRENRLYLGQGTRLTRFNNIMDFVRNGTQPPPPEVLYSAWGTAASGNHGDRVLTWRGDDLYVSIGTPCNTCVPEDQNCGAGRGNCFFGEIISVSNIHARGQLQRTDFQTYARGIRNCVGITTAPNGDIWFTDNGRDNWGDDRPADELNHAPVPGLHFGYPGCYGYGDVDPQFNPAGNCNGFEPSAVELGPHVASLGLAFNTGNMFPPEYQGGIFIAEHGSWNRRPFIGFRVTHVPVDKDGRAKEHMYSNILEGFLTNPTFGTRWGRPSDLAQLPDGSMLVTDDQANVIWRISYAPGFKPESHK